MSPAGDPQPRRIAERELVFLLGAISATTALGIDMALPAFGDIRLGLGLAADSPRVALTVTLYFFGLAGAQMLYGPFTDRFGRKPVLYAGLALYTLGALGSALAPSFGFLIVSRLVWGIGAAGPRALSLAIGRDLYEGDRLGRVLSAVAAVFMVVPAIAPLLGQAVLALGSWRWVMAAPMALTVVLALWVSGSPSRSRPNAVAPHAQPHRRGHRGGVCQQAHDRLGAGCHVLTWAHSSRSWGAASCCLTTCTAGVGYSPTTSPE